MERNSCRAACDDRKGEMKEQGLKGGRTGGINSQGLQGEESIEETGPVSDRERERESGIGGENSIA